MMRLWCEQAVPIREMVPYMMAATVAVGLKDQFSRAESNDLIWILRPTAGLVEWISGLSFIYDPCTGFVNMNHGIAIAPACSGVNFLIIAYIMSFFSFAGHYHGMGRWLWLVITLSCAYFLTIAVNSTRIALSIESITHGVHLGWLTPERIHRVEGVVVYFFFLSLYYLGMKGLTKLHDAWKGKSGGSGQGMTRAAFIGMGPLVWYLLVALVVPVLTGNYQKQRGLFVEHGVVVVVSCTLVLCLLHGIRRLLYFSRGLAKRNPPMTAINEGSICTVGDIPDAPGDRYNFGVNAINLEHSFNSFMRNATRKNNF
ncbi:MAG: exosortase K [Desulfosalsimonadaceae bacterium]|nr:exosortase K [Desulfosalsimonadaceae bacterium]